MLMWNLFDQTHNANIRLSDAALGNLRRKSNEYFFSKLNFFFIFILISEKERLVFT